MARSSPFGRVLSDTALPAGLPDGKNQKGAPVSRSALKLKRIVARYFMPEVLVLLADLALGSRLSRPSVADTATSDPSRRARTTGK